MNPFSFRVLAMFDDDDGGLHLPLHPSSPTLPFFLFTTIFLFPWSRHCPQSPILAGSSVPVQSNVSLYKDLPYREA